MKYMLLIYMNPTTWESLSEEQQNAVFRGHEDFQKTITASGEMVTTEALAEPSNSATVRVRGGEASVASGAYQETNEFFCGYYIVDCATKERAIELAGLIPDAQYTAIEVRPFMGQDAG
ncbi:MAG: YciI family protein [Nitrososphaerota archaeon]